MADKVVTVPQGLDSYHPLEADVPPAVLAAAAGAATETHQMVATVINHQNNSHPPKAACPHEEMSTSEAPRTGGDKLRTIPTLGCKSYQTPTH